MKQLKDLPKFEEVQWRKIEDDEYDRLEQRFPSFNKKVCPTCLGEGVFKYKRFKWDCDCRTQMTLTRHYLYANLGKNYHTLGFDDLREDKEELKDVIDGFIANWDSYKRYGRGIIFRGGLGTGKTFAQVLILKELVKRGEKVWFTSFNLAVNAYIDPDEKKELLREIHSAACLCIDEIPAPTSEKQTDFYQEVLEWLIRYRVENSLPMLMGTNIKNLAEIYPRVGSLISMNFLDYELEGSEDARKTSSKDAIEGLIKNNEARPVK